jgi:hypothetical protein
MSMPESFEALRRANPRARPGFTESVEAAAGAVRTEIVAADDTAPPRSRPRRRLVGLSAAGAALAAAVAVVVFVTVGSSGVQSASAAFEKAAAVTADSAERSGTAVVRITHDREFWAERTIRWHDGDLALSSDSPWRVRRPGGEMRVVDGIVYGIDVDGRWVAMGSPKNIDPDSGTTPDEYLAAVRDDVGGAALRRITNGMTGLTTSTLDDGSTVYRGAVQAGLIARESGFKEGQAIRVLPFGYVAHDQAADPANRLQTAVTVGPEGVVREIAVNWGAWTYTVTYSRLGETAAPKAPANARDLLKERRIPAKPAKR